MTNNTSTILERVNEIDRNLQKLKVDLLFDFLKKKKNRGIYKTEDILKEVRKVRKQIWDEKYSKII
ncbi:MAG TPA: hypothetical protein ENL06_01465 [Candidatus Portnoybacteria bacterium]|nr:hypothetical protein [Candidatus Portnoybacteria bacterium]